MPKLRLVQGSLLRKVFEAIKDLVKDVEFVWSTCGFSLHAVDSIEVALVDVLLRPKDFEYCCIDSSMSAKWLNLENMAKMLKWVGNDDSITPTASDCSDDITFTITSPDQSKIVDCKMKLMDTGIGHSRIVPEAECHAKVIMPSAEFAGICEDLSSIGEKVVISFTKEAVKLSTRAEIEKVNVMFSIVHKQDNTVDKPEDATVIETNQPVSLTGALKYLNFFTKVPLANTVTISLSSERTVVVEYNTAEMFYIKFSAPNIEEEDEDTKP